MNYGRLTKKTESNRLFVQAFVCLQRAFQNPSILVFETLSNEAETDLIPFWLVAEPGRAKNKNLKTKIAILVYTY